MSSGCSESVKSRWILRTRKQDEKRLVYSDSVMTTMSVGKMMRIWEQKETGVTWSMRKNTTLE